SKLTVNLGALGPAACPPGSVTLVGWGPWVPSERGPARRRANGRRGWKDLGCGQRGADRPLIRRRQTKADESQRSSRDPPTRRPVGRWPAGGRLLRRWPI